MMTDSSAKPLFAFASAIEFSRLFPSIPVPENTAILLPSKKAYAAVLGVGLLEFSVNLSALLSASIKAASPFSMVVLVGICGAYKNRGINICDVVRVDSEMVGDVGVEEADGTFLPWGRVGGGSIKTYEGSAIDDAPAFIKKLKGVSGLSVNCCTGTEAMAESRSVLFDCDVESMEGAAALAVCNAFKVSCYEIRAVSNFVGKRQKSSWKIAEALLSLKNAVFDKL